MKKLYCLFILLFFIFLAIIKSAQSVSLAWDPNSETNLAGYVIYYGTASGQYSNSNNVMNTTNTTVAGLLNGVMYFFVVTAYDASGLESDPSNEVAYRVPSTNFPRRVTILNIKKTE